MRLYNCVCPTTKMSGNTDLYYRLFDKDGNILPTFVAQNNIITLNDGQILKTDTYFNSFGYASYIKYTNVNDLIVKVNIKGNATIKLNRIFTTSRPNVKVISKMALMTGADNKENFADIELTANIKVEQLDCKTIECTDWQEVQLSTTLKQFAKQENGFVYIEVQSHKDDTSIGTIEYHSSEDTATHSVNLAVIICTYKREQYVKANTAVLDSFVKNNVDVKDNISIIVIDNGKTLNKQDVNGAMLIPNANLGGSGGFTRGMMEVYKQKDKFTHFLIMDDDLTFDPEVLRKTLSYLRTEKRQGTLSIGASMLKSSNPCFQFQAGMAYKNGQFYNTSGYFNLSQITALLANQTNHNLRHLSWWYCAMPVSCIQKHGLPMPFFIKWDDMEYGYRCLEQAIVPNGLGVMHEPFEDKYSPHLEYYKIRNALYTYSITMHKSRFAKFKYVAQNIAYRLVQQRYHEVDLIFKAVNDYMKGGTWLTYLNGEKLNQSLMSTNYPRLTKEELQDEGYNVDSFYPQQEVSKWKSALTLNGYLLPATKENYRVVPVSNFAMGQYYRAHTVVNYNSVTQKGFVTTQKRGKLFSTLFRTVGLFFKFLFKDGRTTKSLKDSSKKLTSVSNWEKLLDIDRYKLQK